MRYLVSILLFLGLFAQSYASIPASNYVDHSIPKQDISKTSVFLEDPQRVLDYKQAIDSILSGPKNPLIDNNLNFTDSRYWISTDVYNSGESETVYLQVARPVTNKVILYLVSEDGTMIRMQSGDDFPFAEKDIPHRHNLFKVTFPSEARTHLIFQLESDGELLTAPIFMWEKAAFESHNYNQQWLLGIYYGIFLFVILIYSFFYSVLKEKTFMYYVCYVLGVALLQLSLDGYTFQYLFPNSPYWANHIVLFSAAWATFFAVLYAMSFLKMSEILPKLNRVFNFFLWTTLVVGLLSFFPGPTYVLNFPVINIVSLLATLLIPVTIVIAMRKGHKVDLFFSIAFFILIASATIFILRNLSIVPDTAFTEHVLKFGSALEVIFLSFSMANRYRLLQREKEKAQAEMLEQLEEKNRLQEGMNERLEQQVKERTNEINKQKEKLSAQNKDILDSIRYAQRLQNAILPSDATVKEILPESFVLYKPRDIVSGDFYWVADVTNSSNNKLVVFAAADCTGHGVPGAFVSIMGANYLKLGQSEPTVNTPAEALDFVNQGVNSTLNQRSDESTVRDGMDIAICAVDYDNMRLHFAGAKNPVYIIRAGDFSEEEQGTHKIDQITNELITANFKLIEIKGDKQPIGAFEGDKLHPFTDREFQLEPNDTIYLFSDGYADQFGGKRGKKFMYKKFKELLLSIQSEQLDRQKEILDTTIIEWMETVNNYGESHEQLDDILVMGVRI